MIVPPSNSRENDVRIFIKLLMAVVVFVAVVFVYASIRFSMNSAKTFPRPQLSALKEEMARADIKMGERIYRVRAGCVDCHGENLSGAKVMDDPAMGRIYGANITPFNLKSWSDEEIAGAIRYGIHKEGRSLRFMPSFDYVGLSLSDVAALVQFLRSVPEVKEPSHVNTFGPMAKVLSTFGQMPVMFPALVIDQSKGFSSKPAEEATVEFGRYLANSCTGCHGAEFKGGKIPGGDPAWPPAADIRLGAQAQWTEEAFKEMIQSGISPVTKAPLRPPMPVHLLKQMNVVEVRALWLFLKTVR